MSDLAKCNECKLQFDLDVFVNYPDCEDYLIDCDVYEYKYKYKYKCKYKYKYKYKYKLISCPNCDESILPQGI